MNCRFLLKRFPVCFNLFPFLFLVTPCLVGAVQPYMEWISIKKKHTAIISKTRYQELSWKLRFTLREFVKPLWQYEHSLALWKGSSSLHKKWSFPLRISSVNVTKSAVSEEIYWKSHLLKKSWMENFIFCAMRTEYIKQSLTLTLFHQYNLCILLSKF